MAATHEGMIVQGFAISVLSGDPRYYVSNGGRPVDNLFLDGKDASGSTQRVKSAGAPVVTLSTEPWPGGDAYIPCPNF